MKKRMMAVLLATAILATMAGCGSKTEAPAENGGSAEAAAEKPAEPIEITFAHIFASNGNESEWIQWAAEEIKTRTDGGLIVNVYGDGQLGDESELTPQVISGDFAFSLSEGSVWGDALSMPELGIFGLPYICSTYEEMNYVGSEILPDVLNQMLEAKDAPLICLGAFSQGLRCVMTTDVPVRTADDLQGLKCRVPQSSLYVNTMTAMGTAPTPISSSELYSALSSGIVNAYENDPATVIARNLHEVLGYYTRTNHFSALNVMMMSKDVYESLPAEYQTVVTEVMAEACKSQLADREQKNEEAIQVMVDAGMEIIDLPESEMDILKERVAPMKAEFIEANGVQDIYDAMVEKIAAIN